MRVWKVKVNLVAKEFFQYSLITYLILLLTETVKQGLVSFFFDLNILLAVVLLSGSVMVLTHDEKVDAQISRKKHKIKILDILFIMLLAFGGGALVLYKTQMLGITALWISLLTAGLIVLLALLVLKNPN